MYKNLAFLLLLVSLFALTSCRTTVGVIPERNKDAVAYNITARGLFSTVVDVSNKTNSTVTDWSASVSKSCVDAGFKPGYEAYRTHIFHSEGYQIFGIPVTDIKSGADVWCKK